MKHNYPTVFVHGLGGWGDTSGLAKVLPPFGLVFDCIKALNKHGYEAYAPDISSFAGAWDRACELWAYIMGGTVDYGKVHSEKYGHNRYGKTYPGVIKDWGTKGDHEKINLIGHSFGGPVLKMFSNIVNYGAKEEVEGTPANELSPFFALSKPQKIHSATTLSGVNNGTHLASAFGKRGMTVISYVLLCFGGLIGDTFVMKVYDFGLNMWGVTTNDTKTCGWFNFRNPLQFVPMAKKYNAHTFDSVAYEMQIETCQNEINPSQKECPDQYYFARRANRSFNFHGIQLPTLKCTIPNNLTELITGNIIWPHLKADFSSKDWRNNDGMVNVIGQSAPLTSKYADYVEGMKVEPGMWYNFPVEDKDHFSWAGFFENPVKYYKYNRDMIEFLNNLD